MAILERIKAMAQQGKADSRRLKDDFAGVVLGKSENGSLIVDLSALESADVTVIGGGTVRWLKPQVLEQGNAVSAAQGNAVSAAMTKKAYGVGDVLESGPQKGWLIVKFNSNGSVKLLEPEETAPQGVVTWQEGKEHEAALYAQGHLTVRLWTEQDGDDIIANIVKGGYNSKAKLDVSGSLPGGRYWEGTEFRYGVDGPVAEEGPVVRYPAQVARVREPRVGEPVAGYPYIGRYWHYKYEDARVRCVQDVVQLML